MINNNALEDRQKLQMRWFIIIILAIGFLGSIAASIVIILVTKSYFTLAIPSSQIIIMRPVIRWLFPTDQHDWRARSKPKKLQSINKTHIDEVGL